MQSKSLKVGKKERKVDSTCGNCKEERALSVSINGQFRQAQQCVIPTFRARPALRRRRGIIYSSLRFHCFIVHLWNFGLRQIISIFRSHEKPTPSAFVYAILTRLHFSGTRFDYESPMCVNNRRSGSQSSARCTQEERRYIPGIHSQRPYIQLPRII